MPVTTMTCQQEQVQEARDYSQPDGSIYSMWHVLHTVELTYPQAKRPHSIAGLVEPVLKSPVLPACPCTQQTAQGLTSCSLHPGQSGNTGTLPVPPESNVRLPSQCGVVG